MVWKPHNCEASTIVTDAFYIAGNIAYTMPIDSSTVVNDKAPRIYEWMIQMDWNYAQQKGKFKLKRFGDADKLDNVKTVSITKQF